MFSLGGETVDSTLQHPVEQLPERLVQVLLGRAQPRGEVAGALENAHLLVEAVEEADVAGLVGDLGREEDPLLRGGQARMIGPSSSVTRCSPMKKAERPYMRWYRSSGSIRSCQSVRSRLKSRSWVATAGAPRAHTCR